MTIEYRANLAELEIRASGNGGDGRTVEGIAVPYGKPQRIDSELTEQFERGAFNHQLAAMHRVHFSREHVVWGGTVIGRQIDQRDDAAGLWGAWRVSATPTGDETLTLIRDQVLTELSIGFRAYPKRDRVLPDGTVSRRRADLTEVSVVLQGAYGQSAKIKAVRAAGELDDLDPDEQAELDEQAAAGGMTLAQARALAASVPLLPAGVLIR